MPRSGGGGRRSPLSRRPAGELLPVNHDKYALFVWPAYAITALVFAWMVVDTLIRASRWRRRAEQSGEDKRP